VSARFDWSDPEQWNPLPLEEKVALLKSAVSLPELVEMLGYDITSRNKVRPPWNPDERTPSCHLYEDHFYCYGTGKHGDLFDFLAEEERAGGDEPRPLPKAVSYLRNLALKGGREPGDVDREPVRVVENLADQMGWDQRGAVGVSSLLGLDVSTFGLTRDPDGTIRIPHGEVSEFDIKVYGIKLRHPDGRKTSVPGSQFTFKLYHPQGWGSAGRGNTTAVICEGESDSWAMWHQLAWRGTDVFALPSGASAWKDSWLKDLEPYSRIFLCFDNDRAGEQAFDKIIRKVGWDRGERLAVPALYGDAREAIAAGWKPVLDR
jgi:hypothetical protein